MLEKALEKIKTNLNEFETKEHKELVLKNISESLEIIAEKLLELNSTDNSSFPDAKISEILQNVNSLNEQFQTTIDIHNKDTETLKKDVKDEIELVLVAINNMNHFVQKEINENDRFSEKFETRMNTLEQKNGITFWILILILIVSIAELIIFFMM